jgi:hypothetical protein
MVVESMQQVSPCYSPSKLVRRVGIEPTLIVLETTALTFMLPLRYITILLLCILHVHHCHILDNWQT